MRINRKKRLIIIVLVLLLPVIFYLSLNAGFTRINFPDMLRILTGGGTAREQLVVLQFRLPRILLAALVGMGFALSGCVLQGISRNPLADPGLLGINAGAGIVVIIFIVMNSSALSFLSVFALPVFALFGAALTGGIIYRLSADRINGIQPIRLVLNGIAIQAGINAVMTLIIIKLDDTQHEFLAKWQSGSIWSANWKFVMALFPWIVAGILILCIMAKKMDVLTMGDEIACGLGVSVGKDKRTLLFTAIALAAACVAVSGSFNFVGLIAPHLARKLVGSRHTVLIPACAILGALLLLLSDTIARTVIEPSEIPTGIVVSILGAPYFLFLLISSRKSVNSK